MNDRPQAAQPAPHQMSLGVAFSLWAAIGLVTAFYGAWLGFGGRRFAVALAVGMILFAVQIFPMARGVIERVWEMLGARAALLAPLLPLGAYFAYAAGTGVLTWQRTALATGYILLPALLVMGAEKSGVGEPSAPRWQDYAAVAALWIPLELRWLYNLFPYPPPLRHVLTILLALNTGMAAFLFIRRMDGIGYPVEWSRRTITIVGMNLTLFGIIAIPLGLRLHFLAFEPSLSRLRGLPLEALGILLFTAWPEEFLFRGLIQNMFSKTLGRPWLGLVVAAIIFGCAHLNNGIFPNWRYAILATIAGIFYGRAWRNSRSLFPACLVHGLVDITWHILFR
jgi:membrane protease YdiL (CAAX protease family)